MLGFIFEKRGKVGREKKNVGTFMSSSPSCQNVFTHPYEDFIKQFEKEKKIGKMPEFEQRERKKI